MRKVIFQGMKCAAIYKTKEPITKRRKIVLESGSLLKFEIGRSVERMESCASEKSSIQFWRSRMLRKKSLDISFTGLTVAAGAVGGPLVASSKSRFGIVEGGGG